MSVIQKIYINGRFLTHPITGVNRFAIGICQALKNLSFDFKVIVPNWLDNAIIKELPIIRYGNLKSYLWEQFELLTFLKTKGNPLLINLTGLGPFYYKNQVMTIHDLSFLENPQWFSKMYYYIYKYATPWLISRVRAIITVSEFSKGEIIKRFDVNPQKITVVYNAVSPELCTSQVSHETTKNFPDKYILAVSSLDPRKNHKALIKVFEEESFKDYHLLLVGKSANHFNFKIPSKVSDRVQFLGYVPDEVLVHLYQNASLFVYLSLYEGFGIPPLEAMANRCPVVVSSIPSLKEVCADAAYYVNPTSLEDIRNGLLKTLYSPELRKKLIDKGIEHIASFSWEKSAEKILSVLRSLA